MKVKNIRIAAVVLGAASLVSLSGIASAQVYPPVIVVQPPAPTFAPTTVAPTTAAPATTAAPTTAAPTAAAPTTAPATTSAPATTIKTEVLGTAEAKVDPVGANGELSPATKASLDAVAAAAKAAGQTTVDLTAAGIDPTDTKTIDAIVAYLQKLLPGVKINVLGIKVSRTAASGSEAAPAQAVDGNPSYTG